MTFAKPLIVIGEEGCGQGKLTQRLLSNESLCVRGADFESFEGTTSRELLDFALPSTLNTLADRVQSLKQTTRLVLHGIDRMAVEQLALATKFLAQLRRLYDGDGSNQVLLQPILLARNESAVDTEPYSAIVSVSHLCRLPRFNVAELAEITKRRGIDGVSEYWLSQVTGGQPLLSQLLLDKFVELADLNRAKAAIRDYPPAALRPWQERLARMVISNPDLKANAKFLADGGEYALGLNSNRQSAPFVTRALSLAGWMSPSIGQDGKTVVWRFSELHRHWAAPVLREPRKFAPEKQRKGGEP